MTTDHDKIMMTGESNILVGDHAAWGLTSGSFNVVIGDHAGADLTIENYQFIIKTPTVDIHQVMEPELARRLTADLLKIFQSLRILRS